MHKDSLSNIPAKVNPAYPSTRVALPCGHRYFSDCLRENNARFIDWALTRGGSKGWFGTLTFKQYVGLGTARILRTRWLGRLKQAVYDNNGGADRLRWISATEWQIRDVIHFHLLVMAKGIETLSRKSWELRWESSGLLTGFCRIYEADSKAAPYLAKYTSKALGGEIEVGGYWRGMETPSSVNCECVQKA